MLGARDLEPGQGRSIWTPASLAAAAHSSPRDQDWDFALIAMQQKTPDMKLHAAQCAIGEELDKKWK